MTQPTHIFIGGIYRSGTDLLRNVLNASDQVAICGETHYFGSPRMPALMWQVMSNVPAAGGGGHPRRWDAAPPGSRRHLAQVGDLTTDAGAQRVVDFLYDTLDKRERAMWRRQVESMPREEFLRRLLATDRTERAFFDLLMACYAGDHPIRGEKTPAHIHYVPELLSWFPQARFVHMLRDPRAVCLSQKKKKAASAYVSRLHRALRQTATSYELYMSLSVSMHWLRVAQLHDAYSRQYPRQYYALRFEDLVAEPEPQLRRLCSFLEIDFSDRMLDRRVVNSSFAAQSGPTAGFDRSVSDRWRQALHPATSRWISRLCHQQLTALDYSP